MEELQDVIAKKIKEIVDLGIKRLMEIKDHKVGLDEEDKFQTEEDQPETSQQPDVKYPEIP